MFAGCLKENGIVAMFAMEGGAVLSAFVAKKFCVRMV